MRLAAQISLAQPEGLAEDAMRDLLRAWQTKTLGTLLSRRRTRQRCWNGWTMIVNPKPQAAVPGYR